MKVETAVDTLATVLVLDLSSSMGQSMGIRNPETGLLMTRYDMLLEGVKNVINSDKFTSEDYIGLVLFDANAYKAMELTRLDERTWILENVDKELESYFYNHKDDGGPTHSPLSLSSRGFLVPLHFLP